MIGKKVMSPGREHSGDGIGRRQVITIGAVSVMLASVSAAARLSSSAGEPLARQPSPSRLAALLVQNDVSG